MSKEKVKLFRSTSQNVDKVNTNSTKYISEFGE